MMASRLAFSRERRLKAKRMPSRIMKSTVINGWMIRFGKRPS